MRCADLNSKPGIVMCRDALLHRSHEIQPAFFDSEKDNFYELFFFLFIFFAKSGTSLFQVSSGRICVRILPCNFLCTRTVYFRSCFWCFGFCRRDGTPAGGSSAVEQRTVKCVTAQRSFGREFKSPSPDFFVHLEIFLFSDRCSYFLQRYCHTVIPR